MEALRRGDEFLIHLDVTIERNAILVRARRMPMHQDRDKVLVDERTYGEFTLGENLDAERPPVALNDGVLIPRVPISESSRPRRVEIGSARAAGGSAAGASWGIGQSSQQSANV